MTFSLKWSKIDTIVFEFSCDLSFLCKIPYIWIETVFFYFMFDKVGRIKETNHKQTELLTLQGLLSATNHTS